MSFLDRTADPNRRIVATTGVIVIHALIGYVLVTGLISRYAPPIRTTFGGEQFPLPTPTPTPEKTLTTSAPPHGPTAPPQPFPFPTPARTFDPIPIPDPIPTSGPLPRPTPSPAHTVAIEPKPAVSKNDVHTWVTADDYPARDLREANEGTTIFRVVVSTEGRVTACEIVRSSGHAGLDAAACQAVTRRARFEPASDENGDKAVGSYSSSVLWRIPR
jgi:protein TonB